LDGDRLTIGNTDYEPIGAPRTGSDTFLLGKDIDRVFVVGAGKGIQYAAKALEDILGDWLNGGFVIVKHGDGVILEKIKVSFGGHPIPDQFCVDSCNGLLEYIKSLSLTSRDLVITLTGNGMSSLLSCPVDEVSLAAVQDVVRIMQIEKGLNTLIVSAIRNQLDKLKGGVSQDISILQRWYTHCSSTVITAIAKCPVMQVSLEVIFGFTFCPKTVPPKKRSRS
jgi:glycerate-2-kinase